MVDSTYKTKVGCLDFFQFDIIQRDMNTCINFTYFLFTYFYLYYVLSHDIFQLPLSHTYSVSMWTCMYVKYFILCTCCTCVPVRMTTTGMQVSIETIRGHNIHPYILYSVHLSMWRYTMFICVFVEVKGQYWISSLITVHLSFCRVSHWPCQFSKTSWLRKLWSLIPLTPSPQ